MIVDFITKYESKQKTGHPTSVDPDGVICTIPIMCYYAGRDDFVNKCREAISVMHTNEAVVSSGLLAGRILEQYILKISDTDDPKAVLQKVVSEWRISAGITAGIVDTSIARFVEEVVEADLTTTTVEKFEKT